MAKYDVSLKREEYRNAEEHLRLVGDKNADYLVAKWCLVATAIWMCLAHLPRWVNVNMANHDSLSIVRYDGNTSIALGRFLQPIFSAIHGYISSPFIIGIASTLFLGVALYIICKLLNYRKPIIIVILSGIFATSYVITIHGASFIFSLDSTMFAFLLAVVAVFLTARFRFGFIGAIFCFASIFALSPAYINVAVGLVLVYLFKCAIDGKPLHYILIVGVKALLFIGFGAALYLIMYPVVQDIAGVAASSYKGFDSLTNGVSIASVVKQIPAAYVLPFRVLLQPPEFGALLIGCANVMLFLITLFLLFWNYYRNGLGVVHIVVSVILLLLIPLGVNCAYLVVSDAYHELFYLSFNMFYLITLMAFKNPRICKLLSEKEGKPLLRRARACLIVLIGICFSVILSLNVIYANQVYVKKDMEAQATLSIMTRIVDEIESLDGYEPNVTPVALVGELRQNEPYSQRLQGFNWFKGYGLEGVYSVTYKDTYRRYIRNLKLPMIVLGDGEIIEISARQSTIDMPTFPHKGYCQMVDGVAVVKLSQI